MQNVVILFFLVYFGFQIFSQMYGRYLSTGIPASRNYLQNFVSALVLIGLVSYFTQPDIEFNPLNLGAVIGVFIFMFLYCYAKKTMDEQTEKERQNGEHNGKKSLQVIIIIFYAFIALAFSGIYMMNVDKSSRLRILLGAVLLAVLYFTFYIFKNPDHTENKFPLSLFLYPFLFLTNDLGNMRSLSFLYSIIFTTVVSLWGFFGIEWFTGTKKEFEGTINRGMCKSYLGITDEDLSQNPTPKIQADINKRNINYIYIAITLIFVMFIAGLLFTYVSLKYIWNNN